MEYATPSLVSEHDEDLLGTTQQHQHQQQEEGTRPPPPIISSMETSTTRTRQQQQTSTTAFASEYNPEDIPQYRQLLENDHDDTAAWAINIALIFFLSLVCISVLLSFVVIKEYGFIALVFLSIMIIFVLFLAYFVDQTILKKNEKLRPVRNKIFVAVETFQQAMADEYHLFKEDWNEYQLLLTNGEEYGNDGDERQQQSNTPKMKRKKSKFFKMVKPFLGATKRKLFKRKKGTKKQNNNNQTTATDGEYNPPTTTAEMEMV